MPGGADIEALLAKHTSSKREREILENFAGECCRATGRKCPPLTEGSAGVLAFVEKQQSWGCPPLSLESLEHLGKP